MAVSLYVTTLNEISKKELIEAKKMNKADQFVIIAPEGATITCEMYPLFHSLKVQPEFISASDDSELTTLFLLGMLSGRNCDVFNIVSTEPYVVALDGLIINTGKSTTTINIYSNIKEAILSKGKRVMKKADIVNSETESITEEIIEETDDEDYNNDDYYDDSSSEELSDEDVDNDIAQEVAEENDGEPELDEASPELIDALSMLGLSKYANEIATCLNQSESGAFMSFHVKLKIYLGKEIADNICNLLEDEYDSLKSLA